MSGIQDVNLFQPNGFQIAIDRKNLPAISFFAQSVMHPSVQTQAAEYSVPRVQSIPMPADTVAYGELSIMGMLDADFKCYTEIYDWMLSLVNSKYINPVNKQDQEIPSHCDITVIALTSASTPNITIRYKDCVPTSVGDINFEAAVGDVQIVVVPITFRFSHFTVTTLDSPTSSNSSVFNSFNVSS
jgi:hypothetical protein